MSNTTTTHGINQYNVGDSFEGFLLIKNYTKGTARNGNPFLTVTLGDSTGDVRMMVWNAGPQEEQMFKSGQVMWFKGEITEFQSNRQLNCFDYRTATPSDNVKPIDFLQKAPIEGNVLLARVVADVNNIKNDVIREVTLAILNENADEFKTHPAAKSVHHAYVGGLAYHTYSMLSVGKTMCELYPVLNKDLIVAGIVLHDIGKITEYSGYMNTEVTLEGRLKGHISIMSEEIGRVAKDIGHEGKHEVLLLQHMVLSHHGLQSHGWGSAVSPQIIEANVLHHIDKLDAEMDAYTHAVNNTKKGEFTERIFGLDNRAFFNHGLNDK